MKLCAIVAGMMYLARLTREIGSGVHVIKTLNAPKRLHPLWSLSTSKSLYNRYNKRLIYTYIHGYLDQEPQKVYF